MTTEAPETSPTIGPVSESEGAADTSAPRWIDCILNDPLRGDHTPLVLGWSDEQLQPIVERLDPKLPIGLTLKWKLAIAACVRSIVSEKKLTGAGVHYPRGKEAYRRPKRYRTADPRYSWHYVTGAMDVLHRSGLIHHAVGRWSRCGNGRQSVAWATEDLMDLLDPVVDVSAPHALPEHIETIVLRDRDDKRDLDYADTAETMAMRVQAETINTALARLQLYRDGEKFDIPIGRRVFNGSFQRGGRFYCHGVSYQNIPRGERHALELVIGGVPHPVVEIDYANLHVAMAYTEAQQRVPAGDQYALKGFDRALVKLAVNTMLNAATRNSSVLAITEELRYNHPLRAASGIPAATRSTCRKLAERVVAAIEQKHLRIERYFNSDCGARFQRLDSDMAMQVMTRMIRRTGRCPLPMHDSFLVADIDAVTLAHTMSEVATEHGLRLTLKDSRGHRWSTTPFHLEVKTPDLRRQEGNAGGRKAVSGTAGNEYGHLVVVEG